MARRGQGQREGGVPGDERDRPVGDRSLTGVLYVVATPIGNREDITLRALRVLREVAVIAAEDTRRTRALLTHYDIATPLLSYREHNRAAATAAVLAHLETVAVALVSDAGLPAISDPGAELIRAVIEQDGRVEVVPGANAALVALLASGLAPAPFLFAGFLSRQRGDRRAQLADLAGRPETLVFYEAPHRIIETLHDVEAMLGDREAAACRELTKLHEETRRGRISALREHFVRTSPRGEFTLVVAGAPLSALSAAPDEAEIDRRLSAAMAHGDDMRAVIASLAATYRQPRRTFYARWQDLRRQTPVHDGS